MATFPDIKPSYGTSKKNAPKTRTIKFADGYEHRIFLGLDAHQNPKEFSFTWNISESESDTIEQFLDARALDRASFDYQPEGEPSSMKFVCESWNKSIPFNDRATITATFREVFEPAS
tara:strand:- start:2948 stop:3301 length:354 start_codon:yes stop_codon:yes gene_type:complete